jgi:hypothetical protein
VQKELSSHNKFPINNGKKRNWPPEKAGYVLIEHLKKERPLLDGHTMFNNTDGCAKQYCCATVIHLLSMLATEFNITINQLVGAPGHGKDLVDGLNACDKQYLKKMMMRITLPGNKQSAAEEKTIIPYSVKERKFASIAKEAARLCSLDRFEGAKGDKKNNKREEAAVMKKQINHVRTREDVLQEGLRMKLEGLPAKGAHIGLLVGRYNLLVDPDLGVGTAVKRRIPCAYAACEEYRKRPGNPTFHQRTNLASNRIALVRAGQFSKRRMTGGLLSRCHQKKMLTSYTLNNHRRKSWVE